MARCIVNWLLCGLAEYTELAWLTGKEPTLPLSLSELWLGLGYLLTGRIRVGLISVAA